MKTLKALLLLLSACLINAADKPNVLLICIDDLRPELKSFGVDYIHSPHIDRLAAAGRPFSAIMYKHPHAGLLVYTPHRALRLLR